MATKKTTAKKTKTPKKRTTKEHTSNPDLVDDEGFAAVKGDLLWKYRAISAEWNEAQALLREAQQAERTEYLKDIYSPLRKIKSDIQQKQVETAAKTSELQSVQNLIAERFGIPSLANCAIDSTTGRIYILDPAGTSVQKPATPSTLKRESKQAKTSSSTKKSATGKRKKE